MNKADGQEILMPMVQPAELWLLSGRFNQYGPELLRFKDRKDSWFCLGPTHEEVVTALVRDHVKSYKNLPLTLYQIQTKFRDEIRPRFGLMRGREFIMKDAYSFCADKESQDKVYKDMWDAYHRIFTRCGLKFRAVRADTGSIGGDMSHEFQVLAQSGEDAIASCNACGYAANVELAEIMPLEVTQIISEKMPYKIQTPGQISVADQAKFLGIAEENIVKSLAYEVDGQRYLVLVRGHHQVSDAKLKRALKADLLSLVSEEEAYKTIGPRGFIGPIGLSSSIKVIADHSLNGQHDLIVGANILDTHYAGIDVIRDINPAFFDIREATAFDPCAQCGKPLQILRGIEVGHIFYLGKKYSKSLSATIQNAHGETVEMEMGCYGIGIGRTAAAAIEQNHDEGGIIWPQAIAPYHVHLVQLGVEETLKEACHEIYKNLSSLGIEVLWDDRDERAGVKLNDADLLGCPFRLTVGSRGLKNREIEILPRNAQAFEPIKIALDENCIQEIQKIVGLNQ
jgi:prolyl-tRNA synthetase